MLLGLLISSQLLDESLASDQPVRACGQMLNQQLDAICSGRYHTITGKKRSDQLTFDDFNMESYGMEPLEDTLMLDYVDNLRPLRLMGGLRHHRLRRGIVEECCHKSCSTATLREYCG